ncbi:MAG: hypothetical protein EVA57_01230 [alpha proteobacterium HIMB59]|nr:MAG: hypothetical protein EVA57_01230 [alpha proteobacterium HIMB59]
MSNIKKFFLFFIFFFILNNLNGQEIPKTKSYYVVDSYCCGGEDSDPHAVFGVESPNGYILLGKSLDDTYTENGFAVKISKNLPDEKLFLHPDEEETFDWSLVDGENGMREGFNSAVVFNEHIFIAGYKETKKNVIDRYLIKVGLSDGKVVWSKTFPSKSNKKSSAFESVILTNENGILLTGVTNSSYDELEGFKSYGNPTSGNAFSMYLSSENLISNDPPLNPNWEKQYKNSLTGKSIKNINGSNDFLIASSSHEPTVAKVLKIDKDGNLIWDKKYPNHGEITDIVSFQDSFYLSGHNGSHRTGIDGSITKISSDGKKIWNKSYGNTKEVNHDFFEESLVENNLIFDECWSITSILNEGIVMACGTGIEECESVPENTQAKCEEDPRTTWRSYLVKIDSSGDIIWEKTGSFTFPGEEDTDDLPSTASEWIFITQEGYVASIIDLAFGIGLEILE